MGTLGEASLLSMQRARTGIPVGGVIAMATCSVIFTTFMAKSFRISLAKNHQVAGDFLYNPRCILALIHDLRRLIFSPSPFAETIAPTDRAWFFFGSSGFPAAPTPRPMKTDFARLAGKEIADPDPLATSEARVLAKKRRTRVIWPNGTGRIRGSSP